MSIRDTYRDLYADIRRKKYFLVFTASIFFLSVTLSIITPVPELMKMEVLRVTGFLRHIQQELDNRTLFYIIAYIFAKNAVASFVVIISGAFFSIIPIFCLIMNGYFLGAISPPLSLSSIWELIPHGVFELSAVFLAASYGIWLGLWPFNRNRLVN